MMAPPLVRVNDGVFANEGDGIGAETVAWSLYLAHYERSCRRSVTNLDESRPSPMSSCGGGTRYCRSPGGIAANCRGTCERDRNRCRRCRAHAARAFG